MRLCLAALLLPGYENIGASRQRVSPPRARGNASAAEILQQGAQAFKHGSRYLGSEDVREKMLHMDAVKQPWEDRVRDMNEQDFILSSDE